MSVCLERDGKMFEGRVGGGGDGIFVGEVDEVRVFGVGGGGRKRERMVDEGGWGGRIMYAVLSNVSINRETANISYITYKSQAYP